jgi:hypothetical protein
MPEVSSDVFSPYKGSKRIPYTIAQNRLNKNIYYYDYAHLERFLKESTNSCSIERFQGLFGEIFENNVYENIMEWARKDKKVEWFALKGAYVKERFRRNGLSFSSKKQLVYNIDGLDFAEFDALFVRDNTIYFVEMTNSIKANVSRRYKKRIYQKTQLLNKIFPQYEAICLVVLNNLMRDQNNWPKNCMFWYVNQLKLDDKMLVKMTTHKWLKYKKFDKNITQNEFPRFDYYASVRSATKLLRQKMYSKEEFARKMEKLFGLHNKFYYGTVNRKTLNQLDVAWPEIPKSTDTFYVALKMEPFTYPILTFYYYNEHNNLFGIKLDILKKEPIHEDVMKRKRTAIDLRKLKRELQEKPVSVAFLNYLCEEINGQFCMMV